MHYLGLDSKKLKGEKDTRRRVRGRDNMPREYFWKLSKDVNWAGSERQRRHR